MKRQHSVPGEKRMNDCTSRVRASPTTSQRTKAAFLLSLPDKFPPSQIQCLLQWRRWQWMHFRQAQEEKIRNRKEVSQQHSGKPGTVECYMGHSYCLVYTQLFGACQQVLLIRQDVVEDKELGCDGVALSSSSTSLPLLNNSEREKQNNSNRLGTGSTRGLCNHSECGDVYWITIVNNNDDELLVIFI